MATPDELDMTETCELIAAIKRRTKAGALAVMTIDKAGHETASLVNWGGSMESFALMQLSAQQMSRNFTWEPMAGDNRSS